MCGKNENELNVSDSAWRSTDTLYHCSVCRERSTDTIYRFYACRERSKDTLYRCVLRPMRVGSYWMILVWLVMICNELTTGRTRSKWR